MLEEIKMLLGITDQSQDKCIEFVLSRVTNRIKKYCNLTTIPTQLKETVVQICVDTYKVSMLGSAKNEGEVKNISKGDTSTSFRTPSEIANDYIKNPNFMNDYKAELNLFRKLRW